MPKVAEVWAVSARVQKAGPDGQYVKMKNAWTKTKEQAMRKAKEFLNFFKRQGYTVVEEKEDKEELMTTWYLEKVVDGKTYRAMVYVVGVPF
jgi:uncharacterized protein (DUF2147 family)